MLVIILTVICICILRYVYCCVYNYVHKDAMYFNKETLEMVPWPKKKFTGKLKRFLTLVVIVLVSSCSTTRNFSEPCTFTVCADKIEIVYTNGEKEVIPIEPGETVHQAFKRYEKEKRKSNKRLRSDEVEL